MCKVFTNSFMVKPHRPSPSLSRFYYFVKYVIWLRMSVIIFIHVLHCKDKLEIVGYVVLTKFMWDGSYNEAVSRHQCIVTESNGAPSSKVNYVKAKRERSWHDNLGTEDHKLCGIWSHFTLNYKTRSHFKRLRDSLFIRSWMKE